MTGRRLLIVGDSFSAGKNQSSWVRLLSSSFDDAVNLSSNGSSQYRVYKKLLSTDLSEFSHIIVAHTSPYRVYVDHSPIHKNSTTHKDCDLIYQDIKSATPSEFSKNVVWYFENLFDLEQARHVHELLIEKMITLSDNHLSLHLTFFENSAPPEVNDLSKIWKKHPGTVNHMDDIGNKKVARFIETSYNFIDNGKNHA